MIQTLGVTQCLTYGRGTSNYAGNTKKVIGNATVLLSCSDHNDQIFWGWALGNIMSPLLFKAQQAPVYADGFIRWHECLDRHGDRLETSFGQKEQETRGDLGTCSI